MRSCKTLHVGRTRRFATSALVSAAMLTAAPVAFGQGQGHGRTQQSEQTTKMQSHDGQHQGMQRDSHASQQDRTLLRVNKLMDQPVYSDQGNEKLGQITNVVFDSNTGDIVYAVLTGQRDGNMYAVPWSSIEIENQSSASNSASGDRQSRANRYGQNADAQRDREMSQRSSQSESKRLGNRTNDGGSESDPQASNADQNKPFGRREAYPHDVDAADSDRGRAYAENQSSNTQDRANAQRANAQDGRANRQANAQSDRMTAQEVANAQTRSGLDKSNWRGQDGSSADRSNRDWNQQNDSSMRYSENDFRLTASISSQELRRADGFTEGNWPDMANRKWAEQTHSQFGEQPYWERDRSWLSDRNSSQLTTRSDASRQDSDKLWPLVKATEAKGMTVVQGETASADRYSAGQDRASQDRQANKRANRGLTDNQRDSQSASRSGDRLSQGDEIGTVQDVVIADRSGQVAYLIIDAGEAIDGEKSLIAVPTDEVEFSGKNESLSLTRPLNELESQAFAEGERPNFGNRGMAAGSFDEGTEWVVLGYEVVQIVPVRETDSASTSDDSQWSRQSDRDRANRQSGTQDRSRTQSDRQSQTQRDAMSGDRSDRTSAENRWAKSQDGSESSQDAKEITGKVQSVERDGQDLTLVVKTDDGETKRLSLGEEQRLTDQGVRFERGDDIVAHVASDSSSHGQTSGQRESSTKSKAMDVTRIRQKSQHDEGDLNRQRSSMYGGQEGSGRDGESY